MSSRPYRQRRGQQTAVLVAGYLQKIAPGAEATSSAYSGSDIKNVPWDIEVKAPRDETWTHLETGTDHHVVPLQAPPLCGVCDGKVKRGRFSLRSALLQAAKRRKPGHVLPPMVVLRPDGAGDKNVGEFVVLRFFKDDREILAELLCLRQMFRWLAERYRRDMLEYTERNGGFLSQDARDELEALRAQD